MNPVRPPLKPWPWKLELPKPRDPALADAPLKLREPEKDEPPEKPCPPPEPPPW